MSASRVAFTFPIGLTLGASNIWSAQLAGLLVRQGWAADVLVHANPGWHPEVDLGIDPAIRVLACGGPKVTEARAGDIPGFVEVYARSMPAVVVQNWSAAPYATLAALSQERASDLRIIGVGHADSPFYYDDLVYYESIIHLFLAVSDEIAVELKKRLPHRADDIVVRPCAVFADQEFPARSYAPVGRPLILTYAGRVTNDQKKMSRVAPFAEELQRRGVDFQLRIVGEGGYKDWLKADVAKLPGKLQARISIEPGRLPSEMPAIWRESDVCLLLSDFEGTSVSMLEAMAQGCVPVVTRVSGTAAAIREGVTGYTTLPGDLAAMADVVSALDQRRDQIAAMGREAHRLIVSQYSYDVYLPWFIEQVRRVQAMPPRMWPKQRESLRMTIPPPEGWFARLRRRLRGS